MSESNRFDVLIVGAGPAGSFAAEKLAHAGVKVALFDGRPPDEAKACGGGVTSKALKAWPFLLEALARTVTEVEIFSPSGNHVLLELQEPFAVYSRRTFDSYLLERARRAGARVFAGRVSVLWEKYESGAWTIRARSGEQWCGSVLAAADGANSPSARRLAGAIPNSEMEVAFGYRAPLAASGETPTVIAFLPNWAGYAWAFPRLDHVSFGIATSQDTFNHKTLDHLLWDFMVGYYRGRGGQGTTLWTATAGSANVKASVCEKAARDCEIEKRLRATVERYAARIPGLAPETLDSRCVAGEDWVLLGDAAGFADPVTGEGIYYALRSAELFAEAYLAGRVSAYEEMWRADFGRELRLASRMRRRFYGSFWGGPFTDRMVTFARLHGGIRRTLCELIAGDQGYVNLKRTLARRAVWPL